MSKLFTTLIRLTFKYVNSIWDPHALCFRSIKIRKSPMESYKNDTITTGCIIWRKIICTIITITISHWHFSGDLIMLYKHLNGYFNYNFQTNNLNCIIVLIDRYLNNLKWCPLVDVVTNFNRIFNDWNQLQQLLWTATKWAESCKFRKKKRPLLRIILGNNVF